MDKTIRFFKKYKFLTLGAALTILITIFNTVLIFNFINMLIQIMGMY